MCVLKGSGLLWWISFRSVCVCVCDQKTSWTALLSLSFLQPLSLLFAVLNVWCVCVCLLFQLSARRTPDFRVEKGGFELIDNRVIRPSDSLEMTKS